MSGFLNDSLKIGDKLAVMEPMGRFYLSDTKDKPNHYVMLAGGSGITPVISNIRAILNSEPDAEITLFYGNRSGESRIGREQLADTLDYLPRGSPEAFNPETTEGEAAEPLSTEKETGGSCKPGNQRNS